MDVRRPAEPVTEQPHSIVCDPTKKEAELTVLRDIEVFQKQDLPEWKWPQAFQIHAGDVEPDVSLLALIAVGDELAMAALYDRHCTFVYSIARQSLLSPSMAENCLHEVFMALWRIPAEFTNARKGVRGCLAVRTWKLAIEFQAADKNS